MHMKARPIGVFDSGVGGLTVAAAITKALPNESLIYFGDTEHLPYGEKSAEHIRQYAARISRFLLEEHECKALVIACNSASAAAYNELRDMFEGTVPVINVIDPMIEAIIADDTINRVGVIGTRATIASGVYQEKLSRRKPGLEHAAMSTPLLARMIEDGFQRNPVSQAALSAYLSDALLEGIDALVLACTHYPLIKEEISALLGSNVTILDSAEVVAKKLADILSRESLLAEGKDAVHRFLVSDYTESFEQTTRIFYGESVRLEFTPIWEEENS